MKENNHWIANIRERYYKRKTRRQLLIYLYKLQIKTGSNHN